MINFYEPLVKKMIEVTARQVALDCQTDDISALVLIEKHLPNLLANMIVSEVQNEKDKARLRQLKSIPTAG